MKTSNLLALLFLFLTSLASAQIDTSLAYEGYYRQAFVTHQNQLYTVARGMYKESGYKVFRYNKASQVFETVYTINWTSSLWGVQLLTNDSMLLLNYNDNSIFHIMEVDSTGATLFDTLAVDMLHQSPLVVENQLYYIRNRRIGNETRPEVFSYDLKTKSREFRYVGGLVRENHILNGNMMYTRLNDKTETNSIFISGNTINDTTRLLDDAYPKTLTQYKDKFYFITTPSNDLKVWESDGTKAGSKVIKQVTGTPGQSGKLVEGFGDFLALGIKDNSNKGFALWLYNDHSGTFYLKEAAQPNTNFNNIIYIDSSNYFFTDINKTKVYVRSSLSPNLRELSIENGRQPISAMYRDGNEIVICSHANDTIRAYGFNTADTTIGALGPVIALNQGSPASDSTVVKETAVLGTAYWNGSLFVHYVDQGVYKTVEYLESSPTSYQEPGFEELSVFPNPTTHLLTVPYTSNEPVRIYNMNGREMMNESLNGHSLDVSSLPPGVYLLRTAECQTAFIKQ